MLLPPLEARCAGRPLEQQQRMAAVAVAVLQTEAMAWLVLLPMLLGGPQVVVD
jgi:hypothetical protein